MILKFDVVYFQAVINMRYGH